MSISVDKLTAVYIKIRERKSEIKKEFEEEYSRLNGQQAKIKQALLEHCKENNADSVKTANGTFYRRLSTKYWTNDWESFYQFILKNEVPEILNKTINQANLRQFLEENPEIIPPGLNSVSEYELGVRKSKE